MKLNLNALHSMYNRTASKHHQIKEQDFKHRRTLNQQITKYVFRGRITIDQAVSLIDNYVDLLSIWYITSLIRTYF